MPNNKQATSSATKNGITPLNILVGLSPVIIAVVKTELPTRGASFNVFAAIEIRLGSDHQSKWHKARVQRVRVPRTDPFCKDGSKRVQTHSQDQEPERADLPES